MNQSSASQEPDSSLQISHLSPPLQSNEMPKGPPSFVYQGNENHVPSGTSPPKTPFLYKKRRSERQCTNCGKYGHYRNQCQDPITSLGVLAFHIDGYTPEDYQLLFHDILDSSLAPGSYQLKIEGIRTNGTQEDYQRIADFRERIRFILVSRRHSFGLIELIRGSYQEENEDCMKKLFQQMLLEEMQFVAKCQSFEELCNGQLESTSRLWILAKTKYERLLSGLGIPHNLQWYLEHVSPKYFIPEIIPPGGQRVLDEDSLQAAAREFSEETRCSDQNIVMLSAITPLIENFLGTDDQPYRRLYNLAYLPELVPLTVDPKSQGQQFEIGDVFYCSYDSAQALIRMEHLERRQILSNTFMFLMGRILCLEHYKLAHPQLFQSSSLGPEITKLVTINLQGLEQSNLPPPRYRSSPTTPIVSPTLGASSCPSSELTPINISPSSSSIPARRKSIYFNRGCMVRQRSVTPPPNVWKRGGENRSPLHNETEGNDVSSDKEDEDNNKNENVRN
jgi:8-oxo-dGTP pyrophosphatase MutT (NUDIX family)